jgi:hypothetical protein
MSSLPWREGVRGRGIESTISNVSTTEWCNVKEKYRKNDKGF